MRRSLWLPFMRKSFSFYGSRHGADVFKVQVAEVWSCDGLSPIYYKLSLSQMLVCRANREMSFFRPPRSKIIRRLRGAKCVV